METGTIKTIVVDKGFGFIARRGLPDAFFHLSALPSSMPFSEALIERRVSFHIVTHPRGPRAENIQPTND